jgi:hypothetical protein
MVGVKVGLPYNIESGSMPKVLFKRVVREERLGIMGGREKILALNVT